MIGTRTRSTSLRTVCIASLALMIGCGSVTSAAAASAPPSMSGSASSVSAMVRQASVPVGADEKPPPNTFGIGPSSRKGPDGRAALNYAATPGASIRDNVVVLNYSKRPLKLSLYAADTITTQDGTFALKNGTQKRTDVGAWITLSSRRLIQVPARSASAPGKLVVPLKVRIPLDATPGDQAAGIVVSLIASAPDKNGTNVALEQRVATRMYIRVAGELNPGLAIENLGASYASSWSVLDRKAVVTYTVKNTGNARLAFTPRVSVSGLVGSWDAPAPEAPTLLLPGGSISLRTEVPGVLPLVLDKATVRLDLADIKNGPEAGIDDVSASTWFWAIPWLLLLILVLAVAEGWRRRRRAGSAGDPEPGDPPVGEEDTARSMEDSAASTG